MAAFDGCEDVIPFALNVGSPGVQLVLQSGICEYGLAGSHILADRNAYSHWYNAQIDDDVHCYGLHFSSPAVRQPGPH